MEVNEKIEGKLMGFEKKISMIVLMKMRNREKKI